MQTNQTNRNIARRARRYATRNKMPKARFTKFDVNNKGHWLRNLGQVA